MPSSSHRAVVRRLRRAPIIAAAASAAMAATPLHAATINGTVAAGEYATTLATQNTPTGFGDNFSELNQALANYTPGGNLELALTGNLEPIGNRLVLFIDSRIGGGIANSVDESFNQFGAIPGTASDDWGTDINPTAAVTPTPAGASILSPAFNPDYALEIHNTGGAAYFINVIDLTFPNEPSNNANIPLGSGTLNSGTAVTHTYLRDGGVTDAGDVTHAFDNTNTAGVTDTDASDAATATKGIELLFEGQFLNRTPGHALRILPFITSADGRTLSNQFLPGLDGAPNPGTANNPLGTPLFDARDFSDRHYLDDFVPTLSGTSWYADPWTGGVAPNGPEQSARLLAPPGAVNFGLTGATLGYLEMAAAGITGGGTLTFNGGSGAAALFASGAANTINAVVNVQSDLRVNVADAGMVSFGAMSMAAGKQLTKAGGGTLTIGGSSSNGANIDVRVRAGTLNLNVNLGAGLDPVSTAPDILVGTSAGGAGAVVNLGASQTLHSLIVHPDATVNMVSSGARAVIADNVALGGNAKIDLADNNMVLKGMPAGVQTGGVYSGVQGLVQQARDDGTWDGPGITTSRPDAQSGLTSLGVASAAQVLGLAAAQTDVWNGQTVQGSDTLVMYTYAGDANLDGFISGDDYSFIDFAIATPGADGWGNGDFNYDGILSGDDYSVIDFNIVQQGAPLSDSAAVMATPVPEPAGVGVAIVALAGVTRRRRRDRCG